MPAKLTCPRCAAPASPDAASCPYCGTVLAVVACPHCFAKIFGGTTHCPHCGAEKARAFPTDDRSRSCPRCRKPLARAAVGNTLLRECGACHGIWVDRESFERICAERETQAAVLGEAGPAPRSASHAGDGGPAYLPCPECGALMNRVNFARCSGILLDMCRPHGTWFDDEELRAIVKFIRAGGLDRSRARAKADLEEEQRRQRGLQLLDGRPGSLGRASWSSDRAEAADGLIDVLTSAGDLLDLD